MSLTDGRTGGLVGGRRPRHREEGGGEGEASEAVRSRSLLSAPLARRVLLFMLADVDLGQAKCAVLIKRVSQAIKKIILYNQSSNYK